MKNQMARRICLLAGALLLALFVGLATAYLVDRNAVLGNACRLGLPNVTLPDDLSREEIDDGDDCSVFEKRQVISGIFMGGGYHSNHHISRDPTTEGPHFGHELHFLNIGEMDALYAAPVAAFVFSDRDCSLAIMRMTVEGWLARATVPEKSLGQEFYPSAFYVARIISTGPPPRAEAERLAKDLGPLVLKPKKHLDVCY